MKRKIFGILLILFGMAFTACGNSTSSDDSDDQCTKDPASCEVQPSDQNPTDNSASN